MPTGPLAPHAAPLTPEDARHLVRRTGFGAPHARVAPLIGLTASEAVRRLLDEATGSTVADPAWFAAPTTDLNLLYTETDGIVRRMVAVPVREKLTLFWHNHLAAEARVYNNPAQGWMYYTLLRGGALGSFRKLVRDVGLAPAMLRYLNGNQNTRTAPNQNYARELLELFTTGQYAPDGGLNYTETDVAEGARALTGWRYRNDAAGRVGVEAYFDASRFDAGVKTYLGQTGAWTYDDAVRIVFEQRGAQTARYLARKLLAFYLAHTPEPALEQALADVLVGAGFEIRPALETLFTSEAFFAPGYRGALVKAPFDLYAGFVAELGCAPGAFNAFYIRDRARLRDEYLLNPPDVAGWDGRNPPSANGRLGYAAWYDSDDFAPVWDVLRALARNDAGRAPANVLDLLALAPDPADPFVVARALAEAFLAVPLAVASVPQVDAAFAGNAAIPFPAGAQGAPPYVVNLTKLLLGTMPHYEWPTRTDAERTARLRAYLTTLATELPEFLLY